MPSTQSHAFLTFPGGVLREFIEAVKSLKGRIRDAS